LKAYHEFTNNAVFTVKHLQGDLVELVTHHGKYVAVDSNGDVYLANAQHQWETQFHLEHHQGKVAFRSTNTNRYLGITSGHKVRGHHECTNDELFQENQV